jgi:hypothetical protein
MGITGGAAGDVSGKVADAGPAAPGAEAAASADPPVSSSPRPATKLPSAHWL